MMSIVNLVIARVKRSINKKEIFWVSAIYFFFLILATINLKKDNLTIMEWNNLDIFLWPTLKNGFETHFAFGHLPFFDILLLIFNNFLPDFTMFRYISIFFGLATLMMLYIFIKEVFNSGIALIGILFVSVNPLFVYYSRQIERYTAFSFLTILNVYLFWKSMVRGNKDYIPWFCMVICISFLCHPSAFMLTFGELAFLFALVRSGRYGKEKAEISNIYRKILLYFLILIILESIGIYFTIIKKSPNFYIDHYLDNVSDFMSLKYIVRMTFDFIKVFIGVPQRFTILTIPLLIFIFYLWLNLRRKNKAFSLLLASFFMFSLIGEIFYLYCFISYHAIYFNIRHFLWLQHFLTILVASSLLYLNRKTKFLSKLIICIMLTVYLLLNIVYSMDIVFKRRSPDYQEAISYQRENLSNLDIIGFSIGWYYQPYYYYLTHKKMRKHQFSGKIPLLIYNKEVIIYNLRGIQKKDIVDNFCEYREAGSKRLWFVDLREKIFDFPHGNDDYSEYLLSLLKKKYRAIGEKHFSFISLYLFALD